MTKMKNQVPFAVWLFAAGLVTILPTACDAIRLPPAAAANAGVPEKAAAPAKKTPRHAQDGRRVAVYAGASYGSRPVFGGLETEYGLAEEGGMLFYPETLDAAASEERLTAVIALGAPERTVRGLERLRSTRPGVTIVSVFPADEVLSVEAVSDLVIDIPAASGLLADENASSSAFVSDAELSTLLAVAALFAEQDADQAPLARFDSALQAARKDLRDPVAGRDWVISPYLDADTGLRSRNHLVIDLGGEANP